MGFFLLRKRRDKESAQLFLKSMELDPSNTRAFVGIVLICFFYSFSTISNFYQHFELKQSNHVQQQQQLLRITFDFFIEKCQSYLSFIRQYESNVMKNKKKIYVSIYGVNINPSSIH